ncbi:Uma2 family endonuclease [Pseudonocardia nigra]|uniref:Uma2 family endonuclease n=1 Tax=Pseudonocardia nigra TaxID=1921578 RepID=UPI001C5FEA7D|nr:Uma2 family endonuclease [Pseudonocardia nigra]
MTALPQPEPRALPLPMTVAEFVALPETDHGRRYELQEGSIVMAPSPVPEHQLCQHALQLQLHDQVPPHLRIVPAVDIDLELAAPSAPGWVRIPDLAIVTLAGLERRRADGGLLRAGEVVLVVEILSPGSVRTDRLIKHDEYADAGIPHYWMIEFEERVSLTACHRAGEFGYADAAPVTGTFTAEEPFPVRLELDRLG